MSDLLLGICLSCTVLENSEFANQVLISEINIAVLLASTSEIGVVHLWEHSVLNLVSNVISASENSQSDWNLHPRFSE